jgi:hypothetical protein
MKKVALDQALASRQQRLPVAHPLTFDVEVALLIRVSHNLLTSASTNPALLA